MRPADVAAAGVIVGATFFLLGVTGLTHRLDRLIPKSLIRGLQLGIGIKLALKGADYVTAGNGYWVIVILAIAGLLMLWRRLNRILFILLMIAGFIIALIKSESSSLWLGGMPPLSIVDFDAISWLNGLTYTAIPQIPLTLLNSVIAVCALSGDLFPGRKISTARMSTSVGLMNLTCSWFGAMPMCHGSGGLAAHYRFGARTGGALVMLGILEIAAAILFGNSITHLLNTFPLAILGIMLIQASVELIRPMRGPEVVERTSLSDRDSGWNCPLKYIGWIFAGNDFIWCGGSVPREASTDSQISGLRRFSVAIQLALETHAPPNLLISNAFHRPWHGVLRLQIRI